MSFHVVFKADGRVVVKCNTLKFAVSMQRCMGPDYRVVAVAQ